MAKPPLFTFKVRAPNRSSSTRNTDDDVVGRGSVPDRVGPRGPRWLSGAWTGGSGFSGAAVLGSNRAHNITT